MEARQKVITKHGFLFPWRVQLEKSSKYYKNLNEYIRQCATDRETVTEVMVDAKRLNEFKQIFKKDPSIFFFVHNSQTMMGAVFCIILDTATPEEHSLIQQTSLAIAHKFKPGNFSNELFQEFKELLYSNENKRRLEKRGLKIYNFSNYTY